MTSEKPTDTKLPDIVLVPSDELETRYANHVNYETTVFDITAVFGEYVGPRKNEVPFVSQHTAMTMAWPEAKLAALFLLINIAAHETINGPVPIPGQVVPLFLKPEHASLSMEEIVRKVLDDDVVESFKRNKAPLADKPLG